MKDYNCTQCDKTFQRYPSTVRNEKRVFCSRECQGQYQKIELLGKANPNYKKGDWIEDSKCKCGEPKDCRSIACSKCSGKGYPKEGALARVTQDSLTELIKCSTSLLQVAQKIGISRHTVTKFVKEHNLDISHMRKCRGRLFKPEDILVPNAKIRQHATIRRVILDNKLLDYRCARCKLPPEWFGKTLTIELDHINGNPYDNRLENLRFLCPNCHSQQPTSKGGNCRGKRKQHKE